MKIFFTMVIVVLFFMNLGGVETATGKNTVEIKEWRMPWENTRPRDPFVDSQNRVWFGTDTNTIGRARLP